MRFNVYFLALGALAGGAAAFPAAFKAMLAERAADAQGCPFAKRDIGESELSKRAVAFDPKTQYVNNTGTHAFVAPSGSDQRGPCPGLNAMANHGYIPHNGVATISQFIQGTYAVFGMGIDLGTFLAIYGAVFDGNLASWSIGGLTAQTAPGDGITNSHNKYESDVSPTRGDLYEYGNDYLLRLEQFNQLYNKPLGPRGYDLSVLTPFRAERFQQSIDGNPYFFNGPFSGVAVQPAAYTFIYRFMGNKSAQYPDGYLNGNVLKSFFSVTGEPGSFKYTPGHERIPDYWYKRAIGDEYTIPYYSLDLEAAGLQYPEFFSVGGNTGKTDTYTAVDISNLTGGVYNAGSLAQGNNALCFASQFAAQGSPDFLKAVFGAATSAVSAISGATATVAKSLGCPQLKAIDDSQLNQFPGYTKSYDGYSKPP